MSANNYFQAHRDTCNLCKGSGLNLLRARFNIDPVTYIRKKEAGAEKLVYACGHWTTLCHHCWEKVLRIDDLIIEKLHKNTWDHSKEMYGTEQDRKDFVSSYIERYPMAHFDSPEKWQAIKDRLYREEIKG